MNINPDFRTRLRDRPDGENETFELLRAGAHWISIQPPEAWLMNVTSSRALEDCERWRVAVFQADGTASTPSTHPRIFRDTLWRRYWSDTPEAPCMPTAVVQTLYDFLVLGPERYEEMTTKR